MKKRVEFSPHDLSPKAFAWYSGCDCTFTVDNHGTYYMDDCAMGTLKDLEGALEYYQDEVFDDEEDEEDEEEEEQK